MSESVGLLSGHCRDGDGTRAADVQEERSFLVWIESTRPDVVESTRYTRQLKVDITTPEHDMPVTCLYISNIHIHTLTHRVFNNYFRVILNQDGHVWTSF